MAEDSITSVIVILISVSLGFILAEIHEWIKYRRERKKKETKIAKILFIDSKGILNTFDSYAHDCHRPEFNENLEMVCIARKAQSKIVLQILDDLQKFSQEMILFEDSIAFAVFDLKWALNDFVRSAEEVLEFDKFWTDEIKNNPFEETSVEYTERETRWEFQFNVLHERFVQDYNFVKRMNFDLKTKLTEKYGFRD